MTTLQRFLASDALASLTAPHGVDRYLELVNPMWAAREVRARIVSIQSETAAGEPVATITLQPTSTWAGHRAGQHVRLGVEIAGRRTTRVFSISSASSGPGERFTITVRANPDGIVSRHLAREARPGTVVHLSQAEGDFGLPGDLPSEIVLLSGGSGITPVMSMLRTLRRAPEPPRVHFVHLAQSPEHQIFPAELAELAAEPWVEVHLVHGGLFSADLLARLVPSYDELPTWACGPAPMIELAQAAYAGTDHLRVEYFKVPAVRSGSAEGDVAFTRSGEVVANSGATLLEQAEDAGLTPEFGCRMGICLSCTSRKTSGTVKNVITGAESGLPDEDIQICVSAPVGDCAIEL